LPGLLIVVAVAVAYFTGVLDPLFYLDSRKEKAATESQSHPQTVYYDLPEVLVYLDTTPGKQTVLKNRLILQLASVSDVSSIETAIPRIIDVSQVYLCELQVEDLRGVSGWLHLRKELLTRVNEAVKPTKVVDVLFKEMLVERRAPGIEKDGS